MKANTKRRVTIIVARLLRHLMSIDYRYDILLYQELNKFLDEDSDYKKTNIPKRVKGTKMWKMSNLTIAQLREHRSPLVSVKKCKEVSAWDAIMITYVTQEERWRHEHC